MRGQPDKLAQLLAQQLSVSCTCAVPGSLKQSISPLSVGLIRLICCRPVLVSGPAGVGKTVVVSQRLQQLAAGGGATPLVLNFSARTSSGATQAAIEAKLERRRQHRCGNGTTSLMQSPLA